MHISKIMRIFATLGYGLRSLYSMSTSGPTFISSSFSSMYPPVLKSFQPILVSVEGNIGAGKTTILTKLRQQHPEWTFIDEPVDIWTNLRTDAGDSLLEIFYHDRKRWSYTFQNCALLTRFQNIEATVEKVRNEGNPFSDRSGRQIFLTERCLDTDHQVFTKMLREDGSLDGLELQLYEKLLFHLKKTATPVRAFIHVNTAPELCYERIKLRARNGEENIPLSYLQALDKYQCAWVDNANLPIIKTEEHDFQRVEKFITELQESLSIENIDMNNRKDILQ